MTIAYFDCFNGAGGDMIVAALIDAGADPGALRAALSSLNVEGYRITIEKVKKQGFAATRFHVELTAQDKQPHRHLKRVVQIINDTKLSDSVKERAIRIFERLAAAEAAVHNTTIEKAHFHEVGAIDAIIDVVGAVAALDLLGVDQVMCSPVPVGSGTVRCDHGVMPVPAPAVAELLKGVPIAASDETGELTTPTAAAILTTLTGNFGSMPAMRTTGVGYGAGTRDGQTRPNLLRVFVGEAVESVSGTYTGEVDTITVLETNLDDCSPQIIGHCMERLLSAGALDVYAVPIHMKKWRSGVVLTVLCAAELAGALEQIIFNETPTFGVRRRTSERTCLPRRIETVQTGWGPVRVKVTSRSGRPSMHPEYEDCRRIALSNDLPLREVLAAVDAAIATIIGPPRDIP